MPGHYGPSGPASKRKKVRVKKDAKNPFIESKPKPTYQETVMARMSKNSKKKKLVARATKKNQ